MKVICVLFFNIYSFQVEVLIFQVYYNPSIGTPLKKNNLHIYLKIFPGAREDGKQKNVISFTVGEHLFLAFILEKG